MKNWVFLNYQRSPENLEEPTVKTMSTRQPNRCFPTLVKRGKRPAHSAKREQPPGVRKNLADTRIPTTNPIKTVIPDQRTSICGIVNWPILLESRSRYIILLFCILIQIKKLVFIQFSINQNRFLNININHFLRILDEILSWLSFFCSVYHSYQDPSYFNNIIIFFLNLSF